MTKKTVIILAHPHYDESLANKTIINELIKKIGNTEFKDNIEIRNIFEMYPDYKIDVKAEQKILLEADTIIFQFPFYWYSVPAILKIWIDEVLGYGFAYGSTGDKLHGKDFLLSFTMGGPKEAYTKEGSNHYKVEELIAPLVQTSNLIGTNFLNPVYTHGMTFIPGGNNKKEAVEAKAIEHVERLFKVILDN